MPEGHPVAGFLGTIASYGLDSEASEPIMPPEGMWPRALSGLEWEKLTGLATAALGANDLKLSQDDAALLLERQERSMLHALRLERHLVRLSAQFESAGLDLIVLKGPALAHTMYPDASWRPFGDLDVLVRSRDWRRACLLLTEMGYRRKFPEPRPGFVERFGHTAAHVGEDGLEIDLHRTLVGGAFGLWMEPEELFDHTKPFQLGGWTFSRLDDTALFMHACVHAALGFRLPLLLPLRDVAQAAESGEIDWRELEDWGRRWKLAVVYRHATQALASSLGFRLLEDLVSETGERPPRRERRALEAYTTERRDRGGKSLGAFRAIRGLRARAAYVFALLFPSREFLQSRAEGAGPASYRRRWSTPLHWFARRRLMRRRATEASQAVAVKEGERES